MDIIGAGRIGTALYQRGQELGLDVRLVTRSDGWEHLSEHVGEPLMIATRNDAFDEVLAKIPSVRYPDLVFVQNGMIRPWLDGNGLTGVTRGLLFFAVPVKGASPEPGDVSPFTGPRAEAVANTLLQMGLPAAVVSEEAFRVVELEKLLWNTCFGITCQAYNATVGEVVESQGVSLRELFDELFTVGAKALEIQADPDVMFGKLCDYSLSISQYRGAVKEWAWRNQWFVDCARTQGVLLPKHDAMMSKAGLS